MNSFSANEHAAEGWHFLNSGFHSGKYNMRQDELLAERLAAGDGSPTLRVYGWKPYAVSLGYNQHRDDFDEAKCASQGIDIVRRPTGGRAIFHAEELTYSVVMFSHGKNINDSYCEISRALLSGLYLLNADVDYALTQPNLPLLYRSQTAIPCFASSTKYEIQHRGKKLVGSAQRRFASAGGDDVVLQHGSILIGPAHRRLLEFMRADNQKVRDAFRESLEAKTTELNSVLGRNVSFDEVAAALKKGFESAWNINFTEITADTLLEVREAEPAITD
jgi:lipoyl(octanoyl) transferase